MCVPRMRIIGCNENGEDEGWKRRKWGSNNGGGGGGEGAGRRYLRIDGEGKGERGPSLGPSYCCNSKQQRWT